MTIERTMLARARAALARSQALYSVHALDFEPGGTLAAIAAGAAMANSPVGV